MRRFIHLTIALTLLIAPFMVAFAQGPATSPASATVPAATPFGKPKPKYKQPPAQPFPWENEAYLKDCEMGCTYRKAIKELSEKAAVTLEIIERLEQPGVTDQQLQDNLKEYCQSGETGKVCFDRYKTIKKAELRRVMQEMRRLWAAVEGLDMNSADSYSRTFDKGEPLNQKQLLETQPDRLAQVDYFTTMQDHWRNYQRYMLDPARAEELISEDFIEYWDKQMPRVPSKDEYTQFVRKDLKYSDAKIWVPDTSLPAKQKQLALFNAKMATYVADVQKIQGELRDLGIDLDLHQQEWHQRARQFATVADLEQEMGSIRAGAVHDVHDRFVDQTNKMLSRKNGRISKQTFKSLPLRRPANIKRSPQKAAQARARARMMNEGAVVVDFDQRRKPAGKRKTGRAPGSAVEQMPYVGDRGVQTSYDLEVLTEQVNKL